MPSIIETRHLRLVRALAEEGGPTRAAARLHLTQSAVSHQLSELEARLGVALFTRVRRRLVLTAAGRRLVEFSHVTLAELARVERELQHAARRSREILRISIECFTGYQWLPPVVSQLRRDHPEVDVRIVLEATNRPISALLKGELDLGIVCSPVRDRKLVAERLFDDEWVVLLPADHALSARSFVRALDLAGQTVFLHRGTPRDDARLRGCLAAEQAPMPDLQLVPLTDAIIALVSAGLGLALMSRWASAPYVAGGQLAVRRFTRPGLTEHWCAVSRRDAASPVLSRFAELLRGSVAATQPPRQRRSAAQRV
jgi:LysR family transcriptional regulator for metE and metH